VQNNGYSALAGISVSELMSDELDGLPVHLAKIKIPSGGGLAYEIPDEDGEPNPVKEFSAVVLFQHPVQMFYKADFKGGQNLPDCGSYDGKIGKGDPGGNCKSCPLNEFGTGKNGGKACKNRRRLYILREGELFPMVLSLPAGSLKNYSEYLQRNISRGKKSCQYVTRFGLEKAENTEGKPYSKATFRKDRDLTAEELAIVTPFAEQIKVYSQTASFEDISEDEYTVDSETGEVIQPLGGRKNV
jgi:hypothetical protein